MFGYRMCSPWNGCNLLEGCDTFGDVKSSIVVAAMQTLKYARMSFLKNRIEE